MIVKINVGLIKQKLKERGLTHAVAAEKMCIPYGSFKSIMRRGTCRKPYLLKIAELLNVRQWELVDK